MPIDLLKYLRQRLPELECPHRQKRRQKIRNHVKHIRMYRNIKESIEHHPVLINLMVLLYKLQ
jgi:hypothetical protein